MSGGYIQSWSLNELCRRFNVLENTGLRWIAQGHIKARKDDLTKVWRVSLFEGKVFAAMAGGKSPKEARDEATEVFSHVTKRDKDLAPDLRTTL